MTASARRISALGPSDPDARTWVNAVRAAGSTVSQTREATVSAIIVSLKAVGAWTLLDRLWLHAAENAIQALTDLKARAIATAVNSPAFTTDRGYTGNGTSNYIDFNLYADAAGLNFARNDSSFGGWIISVGTAGLDFGYDYGAYSMLIENANSVLRRWEINSGTNPGGYTAATGHTGLMHVQRTGAATSQMLKNGVQESTSTAASIALQHKKFGALAYVSGAATFSGSQVAASFIGAGLSGKEVAFYNAMRTYMTTVGVP